jgi:hypothetical protein
MLSPSFLFVSDVIGIVVKSEIGGNAAIRKAKGFR